MEKDYRKSDMWGTCIWGIDETGKLYIGDGVVTSLDGGVSPWDRFRDDIREVGTFGPVTIPEGASIAGLFRNCRNMEKADLRDFHTEGAVDMHSMFENCEKLTDADLTSFNTSAVKDMSRMFCGCRSLSNLDLSSFDTGSAENLSKMFSRCVNLHNIILSNDFNTDGEGDASCGNIAVKDLGKYKVGKVVSAGKVCIAYNENYGDNARTEQSAIYGLEYTVEDMMFEGPGADYGFTGWNSEADGSGDTYLPGQVIKSVDDDMELFATWVGLPKIGYVQPLAEVEYGDIIPFELPEIISENDDYVSGFLEISPDGADDSWQPVDRAAILPASCDGFLIRLCAKNSAGSSYSEPVRLRIKKKTIDISKVHWAESADMTYDGESKGVWLEGLPDGVEAIYEGDEAVDAGDYVASVTLDYDTENFQIPLRIRDHEWSINKAQYDMSAVRWNYEEAFVYDGEEKTVVLTGLPEGVTVHYEGNTAVNAGVMTATASLTFDADNYEKPSDIIPCIWEIRKAAIDAGSLAWSGYSEFVYDGSAKKVALTNLPEDAAVEYSGEEEVLAGKYLARANLYGNYYATGPVEYEWEIAKADHDMSAVKWDYTEPFTFDNNVHSVKLVNVPAGIKVDYYNQLAGKAGDYSARAKFTCEDTHNFTTPEDMTLLWTINRKTADMSAVKWNYSTPFEYDGESKGVELVGLPEGVYATYENNNACNAGVYTAHAVLKYDEENIAAEQPADCQWQINKTRYDVSDVRWDYEGSFAYDGTEKCVKLINVPEGLNVEYKDNAKVDSGKYVASAWLTPSDAINYEAPNINGCTWSISKHRLERGELEWSDFDSYVYDGTEKSVRLISDIGDKIRVEYTGNTQVNAGTYTAVAHFYPVDTYNYEAPEKAEYTWQIRKADHDMKGVVWDYGSDFTYDGSVKTVKLVNVPEGLTAHYEDASAIDAGKYHAVASFDVMNSGNYNEVPDMELTWNIRKANYDMKDVKWQDERSFSYSGEDRSIELTGLPAGLEPVYSGNIATDSSEYLANVDFRYDENNYEKPTFGSCRWKITKSAFDPGIARWDYETPFTYDGTEKSVRLVDVPEGAHVEYGNSRATDAGTYVAVAEFVAEDTNNYNNTSFEPLTWKIAKGEYDMSHAYWDYDKPFSFDGLEKKVVLKGLPEGVFPVYHNNTAVDAGEYEASVSFRIADADNYNLPAFDSCRWVIKKADYDMSGAQWNYSNEFVYNGRMQTVTLRGLPDGVRAMYDGNCATNVGTYRATAKLIPYDEDNYNVPTVNDCNWEIVKADFDMSAVRWDYSDVKVYNEREQVVELENLPNGVFADYSGNVADEVGRYVAKASLRVADAVNYNTPAVGDCDWEIVNADVDMSGIRWDYEPGSLVFDGSEKSVKIAELPEGVTATYTGNTGVAAGAYVATAEFDVENRNYRIPQSISFDWAIDKAECDMSGVKWDYDGEFTYNGRAQSIRLIGVPEQLKAEYRDNSATDVGEHVAAASFTSCTANYAAPEDMFCRWAIGKADVDISEFRWDYDDQYVYDGTEKSVELAGLSDLVSVKYSGNSATTVGRYFAHAELYPVDDHNYNVPVVNDCDWEIIKTSYDMSKVTWVNDGPFTYDGMSKSIYLEGLPEGVVPVYTGSEATDAGEYVASAELAYDHVNYIKPEVGDCSWSILKSRYDMSAVRWSYETPFIYDGNEKGIILEGLPEGLTPVYSGNVNTGSGEYHASVDFDYDKANYEKPEFEGCSWIIEKADIQIDPDEFGWESDAVFTYDGTAKTVALAKHTEELSFIDRLRGKTPISRLAGVPDGVQAFLEDNEKTDVGIYYAKAVLRHEDDSNYREYAVPDHKWEIRKATLDMSNVRWDYDSAFEYDGSEKKVQLIGVPEQIEVIYENNAATDAGSYEAQARFELKDPDNYVMPSPVKGCWWTISKAKYDMSKAGWTYRDDIVYDGLEKAVVVEGLPEGVSVETYSGNKAIEAGNYTAEAIFSYDNKENYEAPELPALRWKIRKKKISLDETRWNYDGSTLYVYDGSVKEVRLVGVPKEVEAVYFSNSKINAGSYIARAVLNYDTRNYEVDNVPDCRWSIEKANIDTSKVYWDYEKPFRYDTFEKSISLRNVPSLIDVRYRDNKASAVGTYTAKAYLTYDRDNYNTPDIDTSIDWEIVRVLDE